MGTSPGKEQTSDKTKDSLEDAKLLYSYSRLTWLAETAHVISSLNYSSVVVDS